MNLHPQAADLLEALAQGPPPPPPGASYEGMIHGFVGMDGVLDDAPEAVDRICAELRGVLEGAPCR